MDLLFVELLRLKLGIAYVHRLLHILLHLPQDMFP